MQLCKEYDTGRTVCLLVKLAGDFYFSRIVDRKVVDRRNLGGDEAEANKDFDSEVERVKLEEALQ